MYACMYVCIIFCNWATYFSFCFKLPLDVAISGNLLPDGCEVQTESFCEIENDVVDIFSDQKSSESKRMRKELQKVGDSFLFISLCTPSWSINGGYVLKPFKTYTGTRVLLCAHYLTALNDSENWQIILKMKEWYFLEIFAKKL